MQMAQANPLWGAPRIHGELLKLGIAVSERTVSRLMPKGGKPPFQTWRTFLDNHFREMISIDFFTVPTAAFRVLFVLVILAHNRRRVVYFITGTSEEPLVAWVSIDNVPRVASNSLAKLAKDLADKYCQSFSLILIKTLPIARLLNISGVTCSTAKEVRLASK